MKQCKQCNAELADTEGNYCNRDCYHQHKYQRLFEKCHDNPIIQAWGEAMLKREFDNMFIKASLADKLKEQNNG